MGQWKSRCKWRRQLGRGRLVALAPLWVCIAAGLVVQPVVVQPAVAQTIAAEPAAETWVDEDIPLSESLRPLSAESSIERPIGINERHSYRLDLTPGLWSLAVRQQGVQIRSTLQPPDGQPIGFESPLQYFGTDRILLRVEASETWQLQVHAPNGNGRYSVRHHRLQGEDLRSSALARLETWSLACRHFALGTPEGRQRALDLLLPWGGSQDLELEEQSELWDALGTLQRHQGEQEDAASSHRQALEGWRSLGDRHRQARSHNGLGLSLWNLGKTEEARPHFDASLELRRADGDQAATARTLNNLCLTFHSEGRLQQAGECYRDTLQLLDSMDRRPRNEGLVRLNLGNVYQASAEPQLAHDNFSRALQQLREAGDVSGEARALNHLAVLARMVGDVGDALQYYFEALALERQVGTSRNEARVLSNIGYAYYSLGDLERAKGFFSQALPLRRVNRDRRGEAVTLGHLGNVYLRTDNTRAALEHHRQELQIYRELGNRRGEATALFHLAESQTAAGQDDAALDSFASALTLLEEVGAKDTTEQIHLRRAELRLARGEVEAALADAEHAAELSRALRHEAGGVAAHVLKAQALRRLGHQQNALQEVKLAIERIESLRTRVLQPDLRAHFLASVRQAYELRIDLEMDLHAINPVAGHARRALELSEQAHARVLLDLVREGQGPVHLPSGEDEPVQEHYLAMQRRLDAKAHRQLRLLRGPHDAAEAQQLELEINATLSELQQLEAQLRQDRGNRLDLNRPLNLDADTIQALLDDDTVLLEYALGERRSFAWRVERRRLEVYELPGRDQLEAQVRAVHAAFGRPHSDSRQDDLAALRDLSRTLLTPLEGHTPRRLVVVPDGALGLVPFAALEHPRPRDGEASWDWTEPLLEQTEITYLPSASVLVALRGDTGRPRPSGQVAVLADPVFDHRDPRIIEAMGKPTAKPTLRSTADEPTSPMAYDPSAPIPFERLPATRREADAILATASKESSWLALGFDAHREAVFNPELANYRIVHFATHGWVDGRNPALSGLVLSQVDAKGNSRPGLLRLHDIERLPLNAELVVLSGCETAVGQQVRGEGMLGLGRGFMSAGAQRVATSLWRVQDRATAELMAVFYERMLRQGATPAAALREAQRHIRSQRRWRQPYYWAAFMVQGDWR